MTAQSPPSAWHVYIVVTAQQRYYTGIATDVERRFLEHRDMHAGKPNAKGAKYFRAHEPVAVVYRETCTDRSEASRREHAIKRMSHAQKHALVMKGS